MCHFTNCCSLLKLTQMKLVLSPECLTTWRAAQEQRRLTVCNGLLEKNMSIGVIEHVGWDVCVAISSLGLGNVAVWDPFHAELCWECDKHKNENETKHERMKTRKCKTNTAMWCHFIMHVLHSTSFSFCDRPCRNLRLNPDVGSSSCFWDYLPLRRTSASSP